MIITSINQAFELNNIAYKTLLNKYNFDKDLLTSFKSHASLFDLMHLLDYLNNKDSEAISFKIN